MLDAEEPFRRARATTAAERPSPPTPRTSTSTCCRCATTISRRRRPRTCACSRPRSAARRIFDWWERTFDYTRVREDVERGLRSPAVAAVRRGRGEAPRGSQLPAAPHGRRRTALAAGPALLPGSERARSIPLPSTISRTIAGSCGRGTPTSGFSASCATSAPRTSVRRGPISGRPTIRALSFPGPARTGSRTPPATPTFRSSSSTAASRTTRPRRYEDLKRLNDCLRERGRDALLAYLCAKNRVPLPWGGFAQSPNDLSNLCSSTSKPASASARAASRRPSPRFRTSCGARGSAWSRDGRSRTRSRSSGIGASRASRSGKHASAASSTRRTGSTGTRNEAAQKVESYRFLQSELRRSTLTVALPGGLEYWPDQRPAAHPSLLPLQDRDPSALTKLSPAREGLGLLGTPERDARPSWLAPLASDNGGGSVIPRAPAGGSAPGPAVERPASVLDRVGHSPRRQVLSDRGRRRAAGLRSFQAPAPRGGGGVLRRMRPPSRPARRRVLLLAARRPVLRGRGPERLALVLRWASKTTITTRSARTRRRGTIPRNCRPPRLEVVANGAPRVVPRAQRRVQATASVLPGRARRSERTTSGSDLTFVGRVSDSLVFQVTGGVSPTGYLGPIHRDSGTTWRRTAPWSSRSSPIRPPRRIPIRAGLPAYPYFVYVEPGAPLFPRSLFSSALAVACALRTRCRFEAALKWYAAVFDPLQRDDTWMVCHSDVIPGTAPTGSGRARAATPRTCPTWSHWIDRSCSTTLTPSSSGATRSCVGIPPRPSSRLA